MRERHDATNDITAPTVGAAEELADSNATIEGLLKELGDVETEAERESVEARLREERRRHAAIRASLDHLHERASMSEVTVRIVTDERRRGHAADGKDDGSWGVGDALHDAGHILTIAAGVVLIGLADPRPDRPDRARSSGLATASASAACASAPSADAAPSRCASCSA